MFHPISALGFSIVSEADMISITEKIVLNGEEISTQNGYYIHWSWDNGADLWAQADSDHKILSISPHYNTQSEFTITIEKRIAYDKDNLLNGAIIGSINPNKHQSFPIVFHIPYFDMVYPVRKPYPLKVQVAAFGHKILTFNSEKTLDPHQSEEFKLSAQSLIPTGLFSAEGKTLEHPKPSAILTGQVAEYYVSSNPITGKDIHRITVITVAGLNIDVIFNSSAIEDLIAVGDIVYCECWLSGVFREISNKKTRRRILTKRLLLMMEILIILLIVYMFVIFSGGGQSKLDLMRLIVVVVIGAWVVARERRNKTL